MNLAEFSVQKRVTIVMATIGLLLLGILSFKRLPQELFPPLNFPQITVVTEYTNAAPEEIETLITKPIEEALSSVAGLKRLESVSREGRSTVIISFDWGQDIDFAALAVREKIDLVKERLPKESEDPVVLKFDPLSKPVMILSVTGKDLDPVRLKLLTEKMLKDNLEKIDGVASAAISGGVNREILVEIDQARLQANHLSLLQVIESIEEANVSYPAGSIKKGLYEYLIRTKGEFGSVKEIEYAVAGVDTVKEYKKEDTGFLERGDQGPRDTLDSLRKEVEKGLLEKRLVLVRDISNVVDGFAEKTSISRYNNKENIAISIKKQANANTIKLVDKIRETLTTLDEDLRIRGIQYEIIYDHSIFIRQSLENLLSEAISGGVLAFIVLFLFLRAPGPSFLVTLSIPVTVVGVFFLMAVSGITINIMSLGGIALGVGMIVDTSIVVLENIFRRRQLGDGAEEGAIQGTSEVIWPVVASNLTTIAVFFPLIVFVPGIPGQLFKDLSWTVIYSQILSTIVPMTVVTMLSIYLKVKQEEVKYIPWTRPMEERVLAKPNEKSQNWFLGKIVAIVAALFVAAIVAMPMLESEVLPKVDQGQILINLDMPLGTRLEETDRVTKLIEGVIDTVPETDSVAVTIGSEKTKSGEVQLETLRPSQAIILLTLSKERKRSSADVIQQLQEGVEKLQLVDAKIDFIQHGSQFAFADSGGKPIILEVRGYDFVIMEELVKKIKQGLRDIPGVHTVQDDMGEPSPETKLNIEKRRAALYGISALDISLTAKAAIEGVVATQYREKGREIDVRVQLAERDRDDISNLRNLLIYSQVLDALIPLKEVAEIERGYGPSEIRRLNQERTTIVTADIAKEADTKLVFAQIQQLLTGMEVPEDFQVVISGKVREVKENFAQMIFAFILSILLVYMIMASQFESFVQPFIIMFTVPLAFIGVVSALFISGTSLNVISLLGVVLLAGIVVNNGIVLIEYINQERKNGVDLVKAAVEAAKVRTRPILMSASTTIVGLLPLALGLGEGAELRAPMAVSVMGGLITSTVLTLFVIPALYVLVTRLLEHFFGVTVEEEI